jgi:hypothetical protein
MKKYLLGSEKVSPGFRKSIFWVPKEYFLDSEFPDTEQGIPDMERRISDTERGFPNIERRYIILAYKNSNKG